MAFSAADPWAASFGAKGQYGSRGDRKPHHGTFTEESQLGQLNELNVNLPELGIDIKALAIAQQLLVAVKTQKRQCYAASTCALFNLVLQASTNLAKEQASVDRTTTDKNPDGLDNKIINMRSTDGDKVLLDDDDGNNESESSNYCDDILYWFLLSAQKGATYSVLLLFGDLVLLLIRYLAYSSKIASRTPTFDSGSESEVLLNTCWFKFAIVLDIVQLS